MTTRKQCEAAARRRWGKDAFVREYKDALPPDKRAELSVRLAEINERIKQVNSEKKAVTYKHNDLLLAAEFVCNVNGGEPSIDQLREVARRHRLIDDLRLEWESLREESGRVRVQLMNWRWSSGYRFDDGMGSAVHSRADNLDDLLAEIESAAVTA